MRVSGVFCVLGTCSGASEHVPKMVKIPLFFFNLELYHASSLFGYPEMYDFFHQHIFQYFCVRVFVFILVSCADDQDKLPAGKFFVIIVHGTVMWNLYGADRRHVGREFSGECVPVFFCSGVVVPQIQAAVRIAGPATGLWFCQIRHEKAVRVDLAVIRRKRPGVYDKGIGIETSRCVFLVNPFNIIPVIGEDIGCLKVGLQCLFIISIFLQAPEKCLASSGILEIVRHITPVRVAIGHSQIHCLAGRPTLPPGLRLESCGIT